MENLGCVFLDPAEDFDGQGLRLRNAFHLDSGFAAEIDAAAVLGRNIHVGPWFLFVKHQRLGIVFGVGRDDTWVRFSASRP